MDDIEYMRNIIASMVSDARRRKGGVGDGEFLLPGFNIPKGGSTMFLLTVFIFLWIACVHFFRYLSTYSYTSVRSFRVRSRATTSDLSERYSLWHTGCSGSVSCRTW